MQPFEIKTRTMTLTFFFKLKIANFDFITAGGIRVSQTHLFIYQVFHFYVPRMEFGVSSFCLVCLSGRNIKGIVHDWGECLFTKIILHGILMEFFLQYEKRLPLLKMFTLFLIGLN